MRNFLLKTILFLIAIVVFYGCKKDKTPPAEHINVKTLTKLDSSRIKRNHSKQKFDTSTEDNPNMMMSFQRPQNNNCKTLDKFNLPEPTEFFENVQNLKENFDFLLPTSEVENFQTTVDKAKALGFYSADLAYVFMFLNNIKTAEYLQVINSLSLDLGLSDIFNDPQFKQMQNNTNQDSAQKILSDLMISICQYLEKNDFNEIMPFVIYGWWLESNYLMVEYVYSVKSADFLFKELSKQIEVIKNLKNYINDAMTGISSFEINKKLQNIENQLNDIYQVYNEVYQTTDIILSKKQIETLLQVLKKYRNSNLKL